MGLIEFLVLCTILGVAVWALTTYIPMPPPVKTIMIVAVTVVLVLILLRGLIGDVPMPRLR